MLRQYRMTSSCRCIMVISAVESLFHLCCVSNMLLLLFALLLSLTSLCSASSHGCQHDTAHICCWVLLLLSAPATGMRRMASAAVDQYLLPTVHCHRQLSVNISCPQGTQQQTHRPQLLLSVNRTDRQMLDCYIDPAVHTLQAALVISVIVVVYRTTTTSDEKSHTVQHW